MRKRVLLLIPTMFIAYAIALHLIPYSADPDMRFGVYLFFIVYSFGLIAAGMAIGAEIAHIPRKKKHINVKPVEIRLNSVNPTLADEIKEHAQWHYDNYFNTDHISE